MGALVFLFSVVAGVFPVRVWGGEEVHERHLPTPLTVPPPGPQPVVGERLSFEGRWIGIPIGHGWIEVKEVVEVEGRKAYHIEAQGHSNDILSTFYPVHDIVHSYLDVETLRPLRFEKYQREGNYRADEVVTFNLATSTATYRSLLNGSVKEIPLPPSFQDLISALYWFRAQPLKPDGAITVDLYTDERIYQTTISMKPPILLELLKRGTFPCLVVEPNASFKGLLVRRGRFWAYFTADARRLPLLAKVTTPWGPMSVVIDASSLKASDASRHPTSP